MLHNLVGIVLRIDRTRVFQSSYLTTLPAFFVTRKQPLEEMQEHQNPNRI